MKKKPCVIWSAPPEEWAQKLRGLDYWRSCADLSTLHRSKNRHGLVQLLLDAADRDRVLWCRDDPVLFAYMPVAPEFIRDRQGDGGLVVADVTADVLHLLDERTPAMVWAYEETMTAEGHNFWTTPSVIDRHRESLILADVITTSWRELVAPLSKMGPVVHIPDYHPGASNGFTAGMQETWRALGYRRDPWQRIGFLRRWL